MSTFEKIIPGAFVVCVALTACNGDRETFARTSTENRADTVVQPNMPAPQSPTPQAPESMQGKDSPATAPLAPLDAKKENSTMPEALHGNNHGSNSVGSSPSSGDGGSSGPGPASPLKKSSTMMPKSPKVIWV